MCVRVSVDEIAGGGMDDAFESLGALAASRTAAGSFRADAAPSSTCGSVRGRRAPVLDPRPVVVRGVRPNLE